MSLDLNSESAQERLDSPENLINRLIEHRASVAKNAADKRGPIPVEIKVLSALNKENGSVRERAEVFDIPISSVSYADRGLVGEGKSDEGLEKVKDAREEAASNKAVENLMLMLDKVPALIEGTTKLRDMTGAAKDMASIKESLAGKGKEDGARIIVYAPVMAKEGSYPSIEVNVRD